jgi:hypothetical protein
MNLNDNQQNAVIEQTAVMLDIVGENTSANVAQYILSENVPLDPTTSTTILNTLSTILSTTATVSTVIVTTNTPQILQNKGLCHFYGDPHVLLFPQRPAHFQHQYWCKTPGEHRMLLNSFVEIIVSVNDQAWWTDEVNMKIVKTYKISIFRKLLV